ncbi:MAG: DUF6599 family protein [Acidobacteriota bacterium]
MKTAAWFVATGLFCAACGGAPPVPGPKAVDPKAAAEGRDAMSPPFMPDTVSGWTRDGTVQRYGPGNLWEYINGGAEQYLAYGFEEAAAARYRHTRGALATLDVYRMTDQVGAFGIYTEERSPASAVLSVGAAGSAGSDSVRFWSGPYYVKLWVSPSEAGATGLLEQLARQVAARLGDPGAPPAELAYFPTDGLAADSIRYIPTDVLGQSFLSKAFQAEYPAGTSTTTLVILSLDSSEVATRAIRQYQTFLADAGAAPSSRAALGDEAWLARDRYHGLILAVRSRSHLLIALGAPDDPTARALVSAALGRLPGSAPPSGKAGRP